jgi:hypothetical protein
LERYKNKLKDLISGGNKRRFFSAYGKESILPKFAKSTFVQGKYLPECHEFQKHKSHTAGCGSPAESAHSICPAKRKYYIR